MNDEIKEIIDFKENADYKKLSCDEIKVLRDYITNLQEKLEVAQDNEESYRLEMQDITKCLGLDEHTLFDDVKDYVTNLQQENERLKRKLITKKLFKKHKVQTPENFEIRKIFELQQRIEKAVEYIKNTPLYETTYDYNMEEELEIQNVSDETASNKLLDILKGRSDE